jgi:hypothetical protein
MSKSKLVAALDFGFSQDSNGPQSLMGLLQEGRGTLRQTSQSHLAEWKHKTPAVSPFLGIEIVDVRPRVTSAPNLPISRAIVNLHVYSTDQAKTVVIADRVESLFRDTLSGDDVNVWYFDFSTNILRVLSSMFISRTVNKPEENTDSYEEIIQVSVVYSTALCDRESSPLKFCKSPVPVDDSPNGHVCTE